MDLRDVALADRFDLDKHSVLLSGVQALTRLCLTQKARDAARGLNTAGYVTGYRGSPVGGVDQTMQRAGKLLAAADIKFEPGLNEDLAATACWGSQQVALRGEGRVEGVFALWYGKGPGVDRSGDVFRHANMFGAADKGGVLVCLGDDHTAESSTTCHQSELAMMDAMMPVLSPAGVQELLDFGVHGWALSRYAGLWVGLKCIKDTIEVAQVVDGDPERVTVVEPRDFAMPEGGLGPRLGEMPPAHEARVVDHRRFAAQAYARANGLDRRTLGRPGAKIGVISAGKSWLDVVHACDLLGVDDETAARIGLSVYKVGMVWPLEMERLRDWAEGLDLIVVVEEKRALIETQIKEVLYNLPDRPRVIGWKDEAGDLLFSAKMALDPVGVALGVGRVLRAEGCATEGVEARLAALADTMRAANAEEIVARTPWFCAGCPHNSSTKIPDGARGYAGIGCHYMVQWMGRDTEGFTQMGGEGANWIGEAPFSTRDHVFQNLGDGTYNHSGVQAIRACLAAGVNITFKILYNDAVAMTGGQENEGGLDPYRIADELRAMGVKQVVAVYDPKEDFDPSKLPRGVRAETRDKTLAVQQALAKTPGVTAMVYVQTCAAEKRRRRKKGAFPQIDRRVHINPLVCEGCGDCGLKSNCVAVLPLETEFGRKRQIDQSACNKDFSCLDGFCPSFVTLEGAQVKKAEGFSGDLPAMPEPAPPAIDGVYNIVATGIGGTGVVTIGSLLSMAAHLEGKGAGEMQMAGLAQKGGAVGIHVRIAERPEDISAIRVAAGEADAVIGGDLVVTGGAKTLALTARGRTGLVCNSHEITTGAFTRDGAFSLPVERLKRAIEGRVGADRVTWLDAHTLAVALMGDAIYANVLMLGAAWQAGLVPLSRAAILRAIELNGAAVAANQRAFELGRWAVAEPEAAAQAATKPEPEPQSLDDIVAARVAFLTDYQDSDWAHRYERAVDKLRMEELRILPGATALTEAAALSLFRLMSYKDEYEVARLHVENLQAQIDETFTGVTAINFYMAPPLLDRPSDTRGPRKLRFGPWMLNLLKLLRHGKRLRGGALDPFGWSEERRAERARIDAFLAEMDRLGQETTPDTHALAVEIAALPQEVRGFGHVKERAAAAVDGRREALWTAFEHGGEGRRAAQ